MSEAYVYLEIIVGRYGNKSVYMDNHRIAGEKPGGNDRTMHTFLAKRKEVLKALGIDEKAE